MAEFMTHLSHRSPRECIVSLNPLMRSTAAQRRFKGLTATYSVGIRFSQGISPLKYVDSKQSAYIAQVQSIM